jgi:hypothetical protein
MFQIWAKNKENSPRQSPRSLQSLAHATESVVYAHAKQRSDRNSMKKSESVTNRRKSRKTTARGVSSPTQLDSAGAATCARCAASTAEGTTA